MSNQNFADFGSSDEQWMSDDELRAELMEAFDPSEYEPSDEDVYCDWYDDVQEYPE
jgi:hypothetical protein